jgi:SAM-dependent methyltransferase
MPGAALERIEGRRAFGADPANYDTARPPYPARVFEILHERCGLGPGIDAFEVGPGTGLATRPLLGAGIRSLVAIEPDERLAAKLRERSPDSRLSVLVAPFEEATLPAEAFDLGCSATAFHWLEQRPALAKAAGLLRPGGWWAMWWNVFGDAERPDPFHDATAALLSGLSQTPSQPQNWRHPFALDSEARIADLEGTGAFAEIGHDILRWSLVLDPAEVRALYATFSQFSVLAAGERERLLDALEAIAATEFGGRVERNMSTALYWARRG